MTEKLDVRLDNNLEQIFDEDKLDKAIKKGKRKSTLKMVLTSIWVTLAVFMIFFVVNFLLSIKFSNAAYDRMSAYVRLTVPNGYISSTFDTFGLLGGRSDYTIIRNVGDKPVVLEKRMQPFGFQAFNFMSRAGGLGRHKFGEWPKSYWEYGYNRMMFFHPQIDYKEYKNDLELLDEIGDDKIIEIGLSLDKAYVISEIPAILPSTNICWYWLDTYSSEQLDRYAREAKEYDSKVSFIYESEALGVSVGASFERGGSFFSSSYSYFLNDLERHPSFKKVYNDLSLKGYTDPRKAPIIGVIVQGTKEDLKALRDNPHIKASSFGVIVDKY